MLEQYEQLMEHLKNFDAKLTLEKIVESNREFLVQLLRDQMAEGKDTTGKVRKDKYSPAYILLKQKEGVGIGAITEHVTFYMKGDLYRSLFAEIGNGTYQILSLEHTYDKMLERVGVEKFGLSAENRLKFAEEVVIPQFIPKV